MSKHPKMPYYIHEGKLIHETKEIEDSKLRICFKSILDNVLEIFT